MDFSEFKIEKVTVKVNPKRKLDDDYTIELGETIFIPPSKSTIREITKILKEELKRGLQ